MIDNSADLRRLIQSPIIPRDKQFQAMDAILATAGVGEITRNFLGVVTQNRRLFDFRHNRRLSICLLALAANNYCYATGRLATNAIKSSIRNFCE